MQWTFESPAVIVVPDLMLLALVGLLLLTLLDFHGPFTVATELGIIEIADGSGIAEGGSTITAPVRAVPVPDTVIISATIPVTPTMLQRASNWPRPGRNRFSLVASTRGIPR